MSLNFQFSWDAGAAPGKRNAFGAALGMATAVLVTSVAPTAAKAQSASSAAVEAFAALPDWSGVWERIGVGALFDNRPIDSGYIILSKERDHPPYKADWEARYKKFLEEVVWAGKFLDPMTDCFPPGLPRMVSIARSMGGLQFVIRPEQTWIVYEKGPVRFIFTDGRGHPPEDEQSPIWEGHSIGHWEGSTLVVDTVSLKGGVPLDRSGLILSDKMHIVERIQKIDANTMEDELTIEDPEALTGPWKVVHQYGKVQGKYPDVGNIACRESQRNPIVNGENTVLFPADPNYPRNNNIYPPDIEKFAVPSGWAESKAGKK